MSDQILKFNKFKQLLSERNAIYPTIIVKKFYEKRRIFLRP